MKNTIMLFRYDLRIHDNVMLNESCKADNCFPIYIYDETQSRTIGSASSVWFYHALKHLAASLQYKLSFFKGNSIEVLCSLVVLNNISTLYMDRTYDPDIDSQDQKLIQALHNLGCDVVYGNQRTLWDIKSILKKDDTPYKVFTPFYKRGCLFELAPDKPIKSGNFNGIHLCVDALSLDEIIPLTKKEWEVSIIKDWDISEQGAQDQWSLFLDSGLNGYKEGRNFPIKPHVSKLSPYIHFGQISIRQLYHDAIESGFGTDLDHFLSELGWREFSYYLLYHFPKITTQNFQPKFDSFPWEFNESLYKSWCFGKTGYPIVDAGMRQLYETGYMHNRVRMICGSFLVKNLLIHWSYGEKWFWDCLFDADRASNVAGWQWVAGTGADAAPYFRIFNPILQGSKFDPDGAYIKKFVPELSKLPVKYLNEPWTAPYGILKMAGVELGENYPNPIVNYSDSRQQALSALSRIKK